MISVIILFGYSYHTSSYINRTASSILRVVLMLMITVFFMPIINYNTSAWRCDDYNGVNSFYDLECFTASHIGYCVCALFNLIMYISICFTIVFTYFECRFRADDLTAKINGRADAIILSYTII